MEVSSLLPEPMGNSLILTPKVRGLILVIPKPLIYYFKKRMVQIYPNFLLVICLAGSFFFLFGIEDQHPLPTRPLPPPQGLRLLSAGAWVPTMLAGRFLTVTGKLL